MRVPRSCVGLLCEGKVKGERVSKRVKGESQRVKGPVKGDVKGRYKKVKEMRKLAVKMHDEAKVKG